MAIKAVIDTNIWISALLNPFGYPARIRKSFEKGVFQVVVSEPILEELADVLNRPRIRERRRCFVRLQLTIEVWKKGNWYLARTPELDFISQGMTQEEAKRNLLEVVKIQFTEMKEMGTLEDYLLECGFETKDNDIMLQTEMVGFEKSVVSV